MSVPAARPDRAAATFSRPRTAPAFRGGWVPSTLTAVLLVVASIPIAATEATSSTVTVVVLSVAGGLSIRHPLIGAALIGTMMSLTMLDGGIHVGSAALASPIAVASCATRGHLRTAVAMAAWHVIPIMAVSVMRGDEGQYMVSLLMQWLLLEGAAVLGGTWGRSLLVRAGAERARRVSDLAEQRRTIARELHDTGVRAMTHVAMLAEHGAHRPRSAAEGTADFARISATARQATEEMRLLLNTLRAADEVPEPVVGPVMAAGGGGGGGPSAAAGEPCLAESLEAMRLRLTADGFEARVAMEGKVEPPAGTTTVLRRCLAEIEANVLRHGDRCAQVAILVEQDADLHLVVLNGIAEPGPPELRGGAGLDGMSERLAAVGGRIETCREARTFLTRIEIPGEREPE